MTGMVQREANSDRTLPMLLTGTEASEAFRIATSVATDLDPEVLTSLEDVRHALKQVEVPEKVIDAILPSQYQLDFGSLDSILGANAAAGVLLEQLTTHKESYEVTQFSPRLVRGSVALAVYLTATGILLSLPLIPFIAEITLGVAGAVFADRRLRTYIEELGEGLNDIVFDTSRMELDHYQRSVALQAQFNYLAGLLGRVDRGFEVGDIVSFVERPGNVLQGVVKYVGGKEMEVKVVSDGHASKYRKVTGLRSRFKDKPVPVSIAHQGVCILDRDDEIQDFRDLKEIEFGTPVLVYCGSRMNDLGFLGIRGSEDFGLDRDLGGYRKSSLYAADAFDSVKFYTAQTRLLDQT